MKCSQMRHASLSCLQTNVQCTWQHLEYVQLNPFNTDTIKARESVWHKKFVKNKGKYNKMLKSKNQLKLCGYTGLS